MDYDSPTILFLQAFILPSELLLEANFCEVLKKMKSFERLWVSKKKGTKPCLTRLGREGDNWQCLVWLLALFTSCVENFLMQGFHPYHLWPNLCQIFMDLANSHLVDNRVFWIIHTMFKSSGRCSQTFPWCPCSRCSLNLLNVLQSRIAGFHNLWSPAY